MQRTRITANLLVGLTVTAISGCVSVEPRALPSPRPGATGPAQDVAPQIVQSPAREVLEAVPDPSPPAALPPSPAPVASPSEAPRTGPARASRPRERADPPGSRTPRRVTGVPSVTVPSLPRVGVGVGGTDVCALGRGYGGWPAGSPESRICSGTYGR
ncbi:MULTISPECIES: hypothetical protein [Streptomyces]|uniref:hypothetical protein n=1 Tax=Streptomyces TaxID=1883 RepID=UPI00093CF2F8|nr:MULTISPECIES: hypothetical protein [unclassified Streptomyces]OKJ07218.1 hypothetical protein AMK20_27930 [Streptomyces sp. TSRI0261]QNQ37783.1 hypothetical protein HYC88_31510 [Streptomyces sp. CB00271]